MQKLRKLRAKKGFTLVELIVVIAIIGVLAAILIPTMLGFVTNSRVTSADSTAASIEQQIDNFLTDADTAGYGMKLGQNNLAVLSITVDGDTWTISVTTPSATTGGSGLTQFKSTSTTSWSTSGEADASTTKASVTDNATSLLAVTLRDLFPEMNSAYAWCYLQGGNCLYVAYTADSNTAVTTNFPTADDFETGTYVWDGNTAGISPDGLIVGTAPKLTLGAASTT